MPSPFYFIQLCMHHAGTLKTATKHACNKGTTRLYSLHICFFALHRLRKCVKHSASHSQLKLCKNVCSQSNNTVEAEFIRNPDQNLFMSLQAPTIKNDHDISSWHFWLIAVTSQSIIQNSLTEKSAVIWFQYLSIFCLRNAIKNGLKF